MISREEEEEEEEEHFSKGLEEKKRYPVTSFLHGC